MTSGSRAPSRRGLAGVASKAARLCARDPLGRVLSVAVVLSCTGCPSTPSPPACCAGPVPAAGSASPEEATPAAPASPLAPPAVGAAETRGAGDAGVGAGGVLVPAIQGGEGCGTGVCDVQEVCCQGPCPSCVPVGTACDPIVEPCTPG
jgi:hypothetical protein